MLLTITYKETPALDLGYLLHKNPNRTQQFPLSFGDVHVFYPVVREDHCTAAMLLELDTIRLVRAQMKGKKDILSLKHYVNDRPYVSSSFFSVAIAKVFGTALSGNCKDRPELVEKKLSLEASLSVIPCHGGESFIKRCFEPLGYEVESQSIVLDEQFPKWGQSHYYSLTIRGQVRLQDLLSHLYVLIPVLDRDKHYWVGENEQEKLLRHGEKWLAIHPEKKAIVTRYLNHRRSLTEQTLHQLSVHDEKGETAERQEEQIEKPMRLNEERMHKVTEILHERQAQRVLDLGCGEGKLIRHLLSHPQFKEILGVDLSLRTLEIAKKRVKYDWHRDRITFLQSSLLYGDERLIGYDAAAAVEVIEHIDPEKLYLFEQSLFGVAQPKTVIITTPNIEYNVKFEGFTSGKLRHHDHRFEWTRKEFQRWAKQMTKAYPYTVTFQAIGSVDKEVGSPTQMAVFSRKEQGGVAH